MILRVYQIGFVVELVILYGFDRSHRMKNHHEIHHHKWASNFGTFSVRIVHKQIQDKWSI